MEETLLNLLLFSRTTFARQLIEADGTSPETLKGGEFFNLLALKMGEPGAVPRAMGTPAGVVEQTGPALPPVPGAGALVAGTASASAGPGPALTNPDPSGATPIAGPVIAADDAGSKASGATIPGSGFAAGLSTAEVAAGVSPAAAQSLSIAVLLVSAMSVPSGTGKVGSPATNTADTGWQGSSFGEDASGESSLARDRSGSKETTGKGMEYRGSRARLGQNRSPLSASGEAAALEVYGVCSGKVSRGTAEPGRTATPEDPEVNLVKLLGGEDSSVNVSAAPGQSAEAQAVPGIYRKAKVSTVAPEATITVSRGTAEPGRTATPEDPEVNLVKLLGGEDSSVNISAAPGQSAEAQAVPGIYRKAKVSTVAPEATITVSRGTAEPGRTATPEASEVNLVDLLGGEDSSVNVSSVLGQSAKAQAAPGIYGKAKVAAVAPEATITVSRGTAEPGRTATPEASEVNLVDLLRSGPSAGRGAQRPAGQRRSEVLPREEKGFPTDSVAGPISARVMARRQMAVEPPDMHQNDSAEVRNGRVKETTMAAPQNPQKEAVTAQPVSPKAARSRAPSDSEASISPDLSSLLLASSLSVHIIDTGEKGDAAADAAHIVPVAGNEAPTEVAEQMPFMLGQSQATPYNTVSSIRDGAPVPLEQRLSEMPQNLVSLEVLHFRATLAGEKPESTPVSKDSLSDSPSSHATETESTGAGTMSGMGSPAALLNSAYRTEIQKQVPKDARRNSPLRKTETLSVGEPREAGDGAAERMAPAKAMWQPVPGSDTKLYADDSTPQRPTGERLPVQAGDDVHPQQKPGQPLKETPYAAGAQEAAVSSYKRASVSEGFRKSEVLVTAEEEIISMPDDRDEDVSAGKDRKDSLPQGDTAKATSTGEKETLLKSEKPHFTSIIADRIEKIAQDYSQRKSSADMTVRLKTDEGTLLIGLKDDGQRISVEIKSASEGLMNLLQGQKEEITRHLENRNIIVSIFVEPEAERNFQKRQQKGQERRQDGNQKEKDRFVEFLETFA